MDEDFFAEAVATLEIIISAQYPQYGQKGWERRKRWAPLKTTSHHKPHFHSGANSMSNRRRRNIRRKR